MKIDKSHSFHLLFQINRSSTVEHLFKVPVGVKEAIVQSHPEPLFVFVDPGPFFVAGFELVHRPSNFPQRLQVCGIVNVVYHPVFRQLFPPLLQIVWVFAHVLQNGTVPIMRLSVPSFRPFFGIIDLMSCQQQALLFEFVDNVPTQNGFETASDTTIPVHKCNQFRSIPCQDSGVRFGYDRTTRLDTSRQQQSSVQTRFVQKIRFFQYICDCTVDQYFRGPL